ncbi:MAG: carbohydrate porin [Thiohalocapsa sp.]
MSINGLLAATGQCQDVSARLPAESYDDDGAMDSFDNQCRGGMPIQLEASFSPDDRNEFFIKFGFAVDNGLNTVSPWVLAPWAADLEDDVQDINGTGRDYLLAAWYRHRFSLGDDSNLGATFGILDSTDYLDGNAYANDEYTQFMNEAFVNSGSYNLPSYDAGAALELAHGPWSINALGMNIGENDDGNNYNFWGVQGGYEARTGLGTGNYRLLLVGTSNAFIDPEGTNEEALLAWGLSFDQELGDVLGAFLRLTWQQDEAAVDYKALYSGGLNLSGSAWGREPDNIGIGYAYLAGGNLDFDHTQVVEAYYRLGLNDFLGLTADVQYMKDQRTEVDPLQEDPEGWIFGLRLTAEF